MSVIMSHESPTLWVSLTKT